MRLRALFTLRCITFSGVNYVPYEGRLGAKRTQIAASLISGVSNCTAGFSWGGGVFLLFIPGLCLFCSQLSCVISQQVDFGLFFFFFIKFPIFLPPPPLPRFIAGTCDKTCSTTVNSFVAFELANKINGVMVIFIYGQNIVCSVFYVYMIYIIYILRIIDVNPDLGLVYTILLYMFTYIN